MPLLITYQTPKIMDQANYLLGSLKIAGQFIIQLIRKEGKEDYKFNKLRLAATVFKSHCDLLKQLMTSFDSQLQLSGDLISELTLLDNAIFINGIIEMVKATKHSVAITYQAFESSVDFLLQVLGDTKAIEKLSWGHELEEAKQAIIIDGKALKSYMSFIHHTIDHLDNEMMLIKGIPSPSNPNAHQVSKFFQLAKAKPQEDVSQESFPLSFHSP